MEKVLKGSFINNSKLRYSLSDWFICLALVFSTFFNQYASFISGVTLGELILLVAVGVAIVKKGSISLKNETKDLLVLYLIALVFTLVSILISNISFTMTSEFTVVSRCIRYFATVVMILALCNYLSIRDLFIKVYMFFSVAVSIYTILQLLFYLMFHIYLPVNILPISMSREVSSDILLARADKAIFRAYGIFAEPSYLAKFLLPSLIISLNSWKDSKKSLISFILIFLALVFSTSMQGVIVALISILFWLFFVAKEKMNYRIFVKVVFFVTLFVVGLALLLKIDLFKDVFKRFFNIASGENIDSSSNIRLLRGFAYWGKIDFIYKLFGVGMGCSANFANTFNITTQYDYYYISENTLDYMNGLSKILVENGLICFAIFVLFIFKNWNKLDFLGKIFTVQWILIMLTGSSLFSVNSVFFLFIIFSFSKRFNNYGVYSKNN